MRLEACVASGLLIIAVLAACGGPPAASPEKSAERPAASPKPLHSRNPQNATTQPDLTDDATTAESIYLALEDPDAAIRDMALEQLAQLETEASAIRLQLLLTDADKDVREDTVDALADAGTPLARELLMQARFDPHPAVREAALEALGEL